MSASRFLKANRALSELSDGAFVFAPNCSLVDSVGLCLWLHRADHKGAALQRLADPITRRTTTLVITLRRPKNDRSPSGGSPRCMGLRGLVRAYGGWRGEELAKRRKRRSLGKKRLTSGTDCLSLCENMGNLSVVSAEA